MLLLVPLSLFFLSSLFLIPLFNLLLLFLSFLCFSKISECLISSLHGFSKVLT
jgi:hypothetical protein